MTATCTLRPWPPVPRVGGVTAHSADAPRPPRPAAPRVAVLGAGPTGLDAALAVAALDWPVTVYEQAGHVAAHARSWGHVRLFTPWSMNLSPRLRSLLGAGAPTGEDCPTGADLAGALGRAAALPPLAGAVRTGTRVTAVSRTGLVKSDEIGTPVRAAAPFRLLVSGPAATETVETADVVLDCTGTWGNPNPTGDGGIPAPGERSLGSRLSRDIPETGAAWRGRRVLLVGSGNSAQTAARDLAAAEASVVWAVRAAAPTWGAVADDPLPARRALVEHSRAVAEGLVPQVELRTGVVVEALRPEGAGVVAVLRRRHGGAGSDGGDGSDGDDGGEVRVDRVVSLTGASADLSLARALQVHLCYATEGPMALAASLLGEAGGDCLAQASPGVGVLRNPEPDFYVLGSKSYGRTPSFLLRVGWEQVDQVVGALAAEHPVRVPA